MFSFTMAKVPQSLGEVPRNDVPAAVAFYFVTLDRNGSVPNEIAQPLLMLQDSPAALIAAIDRETKARAARR